MLADLIAGSRVKPLPLTGSATCVSVDACTFKWDLDDDLVYDDATGTSPSNTWNTIGIYTIGLQVTDGNDGNEATGHDRCHHHWSHVPHHAGARLEFGFFQPDSQNASPATVLSDIGVNYDLVYAWDGTVSSNNWLKYAPGGPSYANTLTALHETMGFWIHVTAITSHTYNIVGSVPTSTSIPLSIVGGGWNLVGYPSASNSALLPASLGTMGNNFTLAYAYHANDLSDLWKLFDNRSGVPGFANDLKFLSPGYGYWVNAITTYNWTVTY